MKVLLFAAVLCRMSLASECDADATSLMQVRTSLERGKERGDPDPAEDAINLELMKAKSASTVIDAEEMVYNAVAQEKAARAAYQSAMFEARRAAAKLKTTQQQADSANAAVEAAQRNQFKMDMEAKRANATAEAAADAFNTANATAAAAKAKADAAQDLSIAKAQAAREAQAQQMAAEENYKLVKSQAKINKTMLDYQTDGAAAATQALAAANARELAVNLSSTALNASLQYNEAAANLTLANKLKSNSIKASNNAVRNAQRTAHEAQKWDIKAAGANIDPSVANNASLS